MLQQIAGALNISLASLFQEDGPLQAELQVINQVLQRLPEAELTDLRKRLVHEHGKAEHERRQRIALIGLRGAGKSTLGAKLAKKLNWPFSELDCEVERLAGMDLSELFSLYGQSRYCRFERRALEAAIESNDRIVIASGGSIVSESATFDLLLSSYYTVWLKAEPQEHMNRVVAQGDVGPMAGNKAAMDDLRQILSGRAALYGKADSTVDTSAQTPEQSLGLLHQLANAKQGLAMNSPLTSAQFATNVSDWVDFDTHPDRYRHWKLSVDGHIATLALDVNEAQCIPSGYHMKLNSYDLGVDIELHDALQRIRFEHPQVATVSVTSAKDRIFCSGANIYMLGISSHVWKVNFCKFTNETRNGIEDSSQYSGIKFLAAMNGACAGGGYELALACDEILLIDDLSSSVSLPEVPLLGVLPGTGGLTRLTDKRKVRRDHADIFCTVSEGLRAEKALAWRLIDGHAKPQQFSATVKQRAEALAQTRTRPANAQGVKLTPLKRVIDAAGYHYETVDVIFDREQRKATITVYAPTAVEPESVEGIVAAGVNWWPLKMARELDDAILLLRSNELTLGTWEIKTQGGSPGIMACDQAMERFSEHWLVKETIGMIRRTFGRLEVSSRIMFAIVDQGSCFAGTLLELALAADRTYMLHLPNGEANGPQIKLSPMNFGPYPNVQYTMRLVTRFYGEDEPLAAIQSALGKPVGAKQALALGQVTLTPDGLDWDEDIRLAFEERASLSPDVLTGMEASLLFNREAMATRIFGRLSAWQNWLFLRPNAVGEHGALKIFGKGRKAQFNRDRI